MSEKFTPYPYQERMIERLLASENLALFVSMGLGKTVAVLTAASELILEGAARGVLLIAPIRVLAITWPDQIARWEHLRWMRYANLRTPEGLQSWLDGSADIYGINPEKLPSLERTVKGRTKKYPGFVDKYLKGHKRPPADIFVLDESSTAKSNSSVRFRAIRPFLHDSDRYTTPFKRRWILTGTPAPNSYLDLHNQILLLDNGERLGRSYHHYKQTYFDSDFMRWKWEIKPGAKETIDRKISDIALVMLGEDWLNVPKTTVVDVSVNLPAAAMKAYKTLEKELLVELETGEIEALSAAALANKLMQCSAGCAYDSEGDAHVLHDAKLKALKAIRKDHPKEPLLVLTSYIHERERLLKAFPEARQFHEKDMDQWKAGKISMWVGDARSLCHGIDGLQVAGRIVVWMSLTYSNEVYQQANARIARMGQGQESTVYRVVAKGTIDEAVIEVLRNKDSQQSGLMRSLKALQQLRKTQ